MTSPVCCECENKNKEIEYLKALLTLDSLEENREIDYTKQGKPSNIDIVSIRQQQALIRRQLLVIRGDVQYMNHHVQAVLQWIAKVISTFLSCCGRLSELNAASIVHGSSTMLTNVSKAQAQS
jgi:hypothetical protein